MTENFGPLQNRNPMKSTPIKAAWSIPVRPFFVVILLTFALCSTYAAESDNDAKTEELAKESQNPIANLISVPFQNNFNFGIGPIVSGRLMP